MHIHVHVHNQEASGKLELLLKDMQHSLTTMGTILARLERKADKMLDNMSELESAISENTTVTGSVAILIDNLAQQLDEMADDAEELEALKGRIKGAATSLRANTTKLADKVEENTTPVPPPPA